MSYWNTSDVITSAKANLGSMYKQIDETIVSGGAVGNIDYSSIANTYDFFRLLICAINDTGTSDLHLRLNNDSGNNYKYANYWGDGTSSNSLTAQAQIVVCDNMVTASANYIGITIIDISNTDKDYYKNVAMRGADTAGTGNNLVQQGSGVWQNSADLINRITLIPSTNNFDNDTFVSLYGRERV